jgi:putative flippase GtrA
MQIAHRIGKKYSFLWQIAKFAFVGVLNTAIDFGVLNALIALTSITAGIAIIGLNAISFSIAVINSYFWNKRWVFSLGKKGNFVTFLTVTLIGLSINTGTVYILTTYLGPDSTSSQTQWANLAKVIATCFSLIWNFVGYKLIVFKKR